MLVSKRGLCDIPLTRGVGVTVRLVHRLEQLTHVPVVQLPAICDQLSSEEGQELHVDAEKCIVPIHQIGQGNFVYYLCGTNYEVLGFRKKLISMSYM